MRGLLVRVGIDKTSGGWNAPVDCKTGRFVFVPIPDCPYNPSGEYKEQGRRTFQEVLPELMRFANESRGTRAKRFRLPSDLEKAPMHLDPDFRELTYGDSPRRGKPLKAFQPGDFIAFYAGLKSIHDGELVYALIGMLELESEPVCATQVQDDKRLRNAHCRWLNCRENDLVVFGKEGSSGLLERCIPIGEWRDQAYRVTKELLEEWGGFKKLRDGYIHRSATLPEFAHPEKFMNWFQTRGIKLSRAQYQVAVS